MREMSLGWTILRFRQYMSLMTVPQKRVLLLIVKEMVLLLRVKTTPALSNCMLLMRFERAVGVWSMFWRSMRCLLLRCKDSRCTIPHPMATAERF